MGGGGVEWPMGREPPDYDPYTAAAHGQLDLLKQLISPENVNDRNSSGWTALMYATYHNNLDVVSYLIKSGADKSIKCKKGRTALMVAVFIYGSIDMIELLAEKETLNNIDCFGQTALSLAIEDRRIEVINILLSKGADPNIVAENGSALTVAAERGHRYLVLQLLRYKADINITNRDGKTAKMLAQENGHTKIVALITACERPEIEPILKVLGLEEYLPNFKQENTSFQKFLHMTEEEMKEIGITIFGRRRKLSNHLEQIREYYDFLF